MATRWLTVAWLTAAFVIGAAATIDIRLTLAVIVLGLLAILVRTRFSALRPGLANRTTDTRTDWIVVLLPVVLAIRPFSSFASLLLTALLVTAAFARKPEHNFQIQPGPMVALLVSSAIVFSRPAYIGTLLISLCVAVLAVRLSMTVDARRTITSLIDGCGLYAVANIVCYWAGIQSPAAKFRIGGLVESTGFTRTIYPLTSSINIPPIIAGAYVAAFAFIIMQPGSVRRSLRMICLAAAILILIGAGTRAPLALAIVLSISVICFPYIARWLGQVSAVIAVPSAFALPALIASIQFAIAPLSQLVPGRENRPQAISSLNGRDVIWEKSIGYWKNRVSDSSDMFFGFGVNGHYRSGASLSYSDQLAGIIRNPELAYMHNSFLQQLFDGGIIGMAALFVAAFWSTTRISRRRAEWGYSALAATVASAALILSGMTEAAVAPGPAQEIFSLFVIIVGVACQVPKKVPALSQMTASGGHAPIANDKATPTSSETSTPAASEPG